MVGSDTMQLHEGLAHSGQGQHEHLDLERNQSGNVPPPEAAGHVGAPDTIHDLERKAAVQEYVVRVECSRGTLFAFMLDGDQRFISFDQRPRMVTRDDALEIQERLPAGDGQAPVSVEKIEQRKI
jgi:hypothetical protein